MTDDRSAFTEAREEPSAREDAARRVRAAMAGLRAAAARAENSPPPNDREEMQAARTAGKAIHQQQRLERVTYTAVEVKALTKQAGEFGYALGRKEEREEIAALCEKRLTHTANRGRRLELQEMVAELRSNGDPT